MQKQPELNLIESPVGPLEVATLGVASEMISFPQGLLLLHPHPLHGGSMANKIVTTLARIGRDAGIPTFALNFRGVGGSAGAFDHGRGEVDDALAVVRYGCQLGIKGVGRVIDLLQVAPAVENFPVAIEPLDDIPVGVLFNLDDDVVSPDAMQTYVDHLKPAWTAIHATGGHFYHGELVRLKMDVLNYWTSRGLLPNASD
jgi:uncharacterized protein